MKIWIENYRSAREFEPKEPTLAIRIFDPTARTHKLNVDDLEDQWDNCPQAPFNREKYVSVLEYTFLDLNLDLYDDDQKPKWIKGPLPIFDQYTAQHILQHFAIAKPKIKWLICHCNAGISRSVAVAHALNEIFDLKSEFQGRAKRFNSDYRGNSYIYRTLCEEANKLGL